MLEVKNLIQFFYIPSNFNLNDFKKIYSDEDKSVSIKYFWDNFNAENYSIWYCEYLYHDELAITSKKFNLIDGKDKI